MDYIDALECDIEEINNKIKKLEEKLNSKKSKNFDYVLIFPYIITFVVLLYGLWEFCNESYLFGGITIFSSFPLAVIGALLPSYLEKKNEEKMEILNDKLEENKKLLLNKVIKLGRTNNKVKNNTNYTKKEINNNNYSNSFSNKKYKLKVKVKKREK